MTRRARYPQSSIHFGIHGNLGASVSAPVRAEESRFLYGDSNLWELAEYGDVNKDVPRYAKKPDEIALGRNCITFEFLRHRAYRNIRAAKECGNFALWQADCNHRRLMWNAVFAHPMDVREVWHIAKSVASWIWSWFNLEASNWRFRKR